MKVPVILVSSLVLGAACGAGLVAYEFSGEHYFNRFVDSGQQSLGPVAKLEGDSTHRFDVMPVYATGEKVFIIKNIGDEDLTLEQGESTCQCTVGKLTEGALKPGESTNVTLEWTPKSATDEFSHTAMILTNDPNQPQISLNVQGRVIAEYRVDPPGLSFGDSTPVQTRSATFKVYSYVDDNMKIADIDVLGGRLTEFFETSTRDLSASELKEDAEAKSGVEVTVTLKPGMPLGEYSETVRFKTNRKSADPQEVSIAGRITGEIDFLRLGSPFNMQARILTLGLVNGREGATEKLHLVTKGEHAKNVAFTIDETTLPDELTIELGEPKPIGGGKSMLHPMIIKVAKNALPVNHTANQAVKVIIKTTHPTATEISFRVDYTVE